MSLSPNSKIYLLIQYVISIQTVVSIFFLKLLYETRHRHRRHTLRHHTAMDEDVSRTLR